jgi:hypothetical protein
MINFLLGTFSGLFISGSVVGYQHSITYTNKILDEAKEQEYPLKLGSYYGAFLTTFSISTGYGFIFASAPIWFPINVFNKLSKSQIKIEPEDLISLTK